MTHTYDVPDPGRCYQVTAYEIEPDGAISLDVIYPSGATDVIVMHPPTEADALADRADELDARLAEREAAHESYLDSRVGGNY